MRLRADRVSLEGRHGTLLPSTSFELAEGELAIVHGEPGTGVTAFGLALAGRLRPSTGTVTLDDVADPARLRERVAVVDAPGVSEPDEALALRVVVGEELALANRPAGQADVLRWLTDHNAAAFAGTRFDRIEPELRTRLLSALAAARPGVAALVLDRPDRHTSEVDDWYMVAGEHAERGLAVVVLTATVPRHALPAPPARLGEHEQPAAQRRATEGDTDGSTGDDQ